jgi:hypothetical protein
MCAINTPSRMRNGDLRQKCRRLIWLSRTTGSGSRAAFAEGLIGRQISTSRRLEPAIPTTAHPMPVAEKKLAAGIHPLSVIASSVADPQKQTKRNAS